MLRQMDGQWQKFVALLVYKLAKEKGVKVSAADIEAFSGENLVLLTHGHVDSVEFRLVTPAQAARLAAYDAGRRGNA